MEVFPLCCANMCVVVDVDAIGWEHCIGSLVRDAIYDFKVVLN